MCGVVGYVGQQKCVPIIFESLKRLEYRGYDSSGIAVLDNENVSLVKAKGKLKELEKKLDELPEAAKIGIGHTRWATHGAPNAINSHPHSTGDFAIVHNGIIENYSELKEQLMKTGIEFITETDTEVAMHVLRNAYKETGSMKKAIQVATQTFEGAYAIGIVCPDLPNEIYIVKQGSPAVIGIGKECNFFASDALALVDHSDKAIFLKDGEFARITMDSVNVWNFDGSVADVRINELSLDSRSADKGGFRHFMLKEIHEQPTVLANNIARLIDLESNKINDVALQTGQLDLDRVKSINIIACGSAYISACVARYFLEDLLQMSVNVELASEFRYRQPYIDDSCLTIAVSQSGETLDTLTGLQYAKSKNSQTYAICNVPFSSIVRTVDAHCLMDAGPEIGVASTKAFSCQILCLYMFALDVAQKMKKIKTDDVEKLNPTFRLFPALLRKVLLLDEHIKSIAEKFYEYPNFLFIGRGMSYPIALEGALKLKEISYIHAEGYAGGELKHGPIALIDKHMPVVAIAPNGPGIEKIISNISEIRARDGIMICLGDANNKDLVAVSDELIHCPQIDDPALQSIFSTIPLQLLAYYIAVKRGTDVDQPRNLAKSVTVE